MADALLTEEQIRTALSSIIDPDLRRDIVSLGFVKDIAVDGADVRVRIELTTPACPVKDQMKAAAEQALREIGAAGVDVQMTAQVTSRRAANSLMPGVRNTIAVASGKGGVGKSTVAANLAVALAQDGSRVGLIDADIYGPSMPLMFGLANQRPMVFQNAAGERRLVPLEAHGVKVMSIGFLIDPDQAVIWRGPMASGALKQFMAEVEWEELDYLIFDMPPGTGDIQLTLTQTIPLTGAVIVTTPQDVALADARKGLKMFERVQVPLLGVIENMSYFLAPDTGARYDIFSHGGGAAAAAEMGVPFLGEIPIVMEMRMGGDEGVPYVVRNPESEQAKNIRSIARALAAQVSIANTAALEQAPVQIIIGNDQ
ncbi:MAG TPA: iron-sulfur cluster carrier protein ApbC [Candidatus Kapabacteria bacterium]|nr:iron-sulfur cluster carrier protein ApbC [Candidatus Kapabacteria bacterium]